MSKRQIRISIPSQIRERIDEFLGKEINLILLDGTVFFGKLKRVENGVACLINMRLKSVKMPIQKISELYTDVDA